MLYLPYYFIYIVALLACFVYFALLLRLHCYCIYTVAILTWDLFPEINRTSGEIIVEGVGSNTGGLQEWTIKIQSPASRFGTRQRRTLGIVRGDRVQLEELKDHTIKGRARSGVIRIQMVPSDVILAIAGPNPGNVETVVGDDLPHDIDKMPLGLGPETKPEMPGVKVEAGNAGHLAGRRWLRETVRLPKRNPEVPQRETNGLVHSVIPLGPLGVGVVVVPELILAPPHDVGEIEQVTGHALSREWTRARRRERLEREVRMTVAGTGDRRRIHENGVKVDNGELKAWDAPKVVDSGNGVRWEIQRSHDGEVEEKKSFCRGIQ